MSQAGGMSIHAADLACPRVFDWGRAWNWNVWSCCRVGPTQHVALQSSSSLFFFTGFELPRALGLGLGLDRSWELIVLVIIGVKVGVWTLRM